MGLRAALVRIAIESARQDLAHVSAGTGNNQDAKRRVYRSRESGPRLDYVSVIYVEPQKRGVLAYGHFNRSDLTPLDEIAAPEIVDLPYKIQRDLRREFWARLSDATPDKKTAAAAWAAASVGELIDANLDFAFDRDAIEAKARNCARVCFYITDVESMEEFCGARGIDPPKSNARGTRRGRLLRSRDHRFWRRAFDKLYGRKAENAQRRAGFINRRNQLYASDLAVSQRRSKQSETNRWLKDRVVISDTGVQLNLWEARQRSQANPALRRAELMTRMRGFEEVAKAAGHVADFYTLTCPSAYHRMHAHGEPNQSYAGHSVRDAQGWLTKMWARARAKLKRMSVVLYGFRVAEPHHDSTPHWHMVLFCPSHHQSDVRRVLREYWLSEGGSDLGAEDHRIKFKAIDEHKGTAAGYLAKYVAKNIDGFQVGGDLEANENTQATETCARVTAWATRHGIRQFQQIGGPAVTVWRELRRLRVAGAFPVIEAARVCADSGDWAGFIAALGGIQAGRSSVVGLWTELTGEINQYDELRGPQIVGINAGPLEKVKTRTAVWRIEKISSLSGSALGPVTITVRGAPESGAPVLWSNPNESSMYGPLN